MSYAGEWLRYVSFQNPRITNFLQGNTVITANQTQRISCYLHITKLKNVNFSTWHNCHLTTTGTHHMANEERQSRTFARYFANAQHMLNKCLEQTKLVGIFNIEHIKTNSTASAKQLQSVRLIALLSTLT
jgi:hypothetical protein